MFFIHDKMQGFLDESGLFIFFIYLFILFIFFFFFFFAFYAETQDGRQKW